MLCLLGTTFARASDANSREELEASRCSRTLSSGRPCLKSCSRSGRSCDKFPCTSTSSSFFFGRVTVSCDEDVGEVGEDEEEELVDEPGTTIGT